MSRLGVSHVNVTQKDIERIAAHYGLVVHGYAPGDGVRRYQFEKGGHRIYNAMGIGEALVYITGYGHGTGDSMPTMHATGRVKRNPNFGKFGDKFSEFLYQVDHDQTVGSVHEHGWYGLVSGLTKKEAAELGHGMFSEDEEQEFLEEFDEHDWPLNAVITEDSQGDVEVYYYKNNRDAIKVWHKIERDFG